ncbi:MAG: efflux RND transporter periplasmic adaptor subunit [Deltaproteobacteria bacterium]|nr:efflux RND transporter periplasmic adaptor subunit [Deltaproteobacteria bacterium]
MTGKNESPCSVAETLEITEGPRRRKWLGWTLLAVFLLLGGVVGALAFKNMEPPASARYKTQKIEQGPLTVTVSATGNLEPTNQVDVGSELSGIIRSVLVEENDRVEIDQVLARLDTSKLEAQHAKNKAEVASAKAKVLQAQATIREAESNLARLRHVRELSGNKVPSLFDMDAAEAALARARADEKAATAAVAQAQATLKSTETDLDKSIIRSPMNGVVLARRVEPGQTVAASMTAPVLFTLAEDLAQMELNVDVDEADVGQVEEDQEATFVVDAYPDRRFEARITRVCYGSDTTDGVVTYETILKLDNKDLSLRPGMTATADIIVKKVEEALLIPNAAFRFTPQVENKDESSRSLVYSLMPRLPRRRSATLEKTPSAGNGRRIWILENGHPRAVTIQVGASDGAKTQVMGNALAPGMEVILEHRIDRKG